MSQAQRKAYRLGKEYGQVRGSWVFNGNTDEVTYRKVLEGYEDGDPEVMDLQPAPLSGEWGGESISELSDYFGLDLEDDDIAQDFEDGFSDGFWSEVIDTARRMVS